MEIVFSVDDDLIGNNRAIKEIPRDDPGFGDDPLATFAAHREFVGQARAVHAMSGESVPWENQHD